MRYLLLLAVVLTTLPPAARTETEPPRTEAEAAAPIDLSGYRLCPRCNTLNLSQAEYCMRCGTALTAAPEEKKVTAPAAVKSFALTPFVFFGNYDAFGGGFRGRSDRAAWSFTPSYAYNTYLSDDNDNSSRQSHYLVNDVRFYFGAAALRPFLGGALEFGYYYHQYESYPFYEREDHHFAVSAAFGGGLELNYDPRGSFFDIRGYAGPAVSWHSGPDSHSSTRANFSFITGNVTYINRHTGLDIHLVLDAGAGRYSETSVIMQFGPSFAW